MEPTQSGTFRMESIELGIINPVFNDQDPEEEIEISDPSGATTGDPTVELTQHESNTGQPPPSLSTPRSGELPERESGGGSDASNKNDDANLRDVWGNQLEFLLSCVSMSVGLGNVWRFPFTAYENGGGAFLIPYMIALCIFGRPMYFLEMCLGQFSSFGPVNLWEISPIFRGVGYASTLAACCTASFYCSIMAIVVYYFLLSFQAPLPWSEEVCSNCTTDDTPNECMIWKGVNRSFSEVYYYQSVFPQLDRIDEGVGLPHLKLTACLLFSWAVLYLFLMKGIQSSGKVSYFTALFPYVVLIALLMRGLTLPGAMDGIIYFVKPDWKKLLDAKVWFAAISQCFFSLNVGFGTITYLSSHNRFRHNVFRDALVISVTDTFTSCLAGCAIFSLLGYLANTMNMSVAEVTRGGPGLAFVAFPESIAHLKFFPQGFAVLFFLMLFTLGVGSAMALAGQVITVIRDQYPNAKKWAVALGICTAGFFSGIVYLTPGGQFILTLVNHNGVDFIIYVTAMIEISAVAWVYGINRFCRDLKFMLGTETSLYWKLCCTFIMPVGLFVLLIYFFATYKSLQHDGTQFPASAQVCGWVLSAVILSPLPICAIKAVRQSPGNSWVEKTKAALKPMPSWGPKCSIERKAWLLEMKDIPGIENFKENVDNLSNGSNMPSGSESGSRS